MADTPGAASDDAAHGTVSSLSVTSSTSEDTIASTSSSAVAATSYNSTSFLSVPTATTSPQPDEGNTFGTRQIRTVQSRIANAQRLLDVGDRVAILRAFITPLRAAALNGDASTIASILETGADVNARNEVGESALHLAAMRDRSGQCVSVLVAGGADVHCQNAYGDTALLYAAFANNEAAVRALLAAGASREVMSVDGCTPYGVASERVVRNLLR